MLTRAFLSYPKCNMRNDRLINNMFHGTRVSNRTGNILYVEKKFSWLLSEDCPPRSVIYHYFGHKWCLLPYPMKDIFVLWPCLVKKKFKISRHIKFLDICIKY
jgi:hypothetical protein